MIRLLREVDYNKSDKTFYFNDAANVARNVLPDVEYIILYISIKESTDKTLTL